MVAGVRVEHNGTFNLSQTSQQWKPFVSEQKVVTQRPGFDWDGRVTLMPGVPVRVHDAYVAGDGILHASLLGLVSLVDLHGTDILYSIIPKLVFEYGVIAGGLMILFLVLATLDRAPWRVVPATLVVMTFALSGALLQPQTAVLVWLLAGLGAGASRPLGIHPPAASGPLRRWTAR